MTGKSTIVRLSLSEIEAIAERGEDLTRKDAPDAESLGAEFWRHARVVFPAERASVSTDSAPHEE